MNRRIVDMEDRLVARFAAMTSEQKEDVVSRVVENLKAKSGEGNQTDENSEKEPNPDEDDKNTLTYDDSEDDSMGLDENGLPVEDSEEAVSEGSNELSVMVDALQQEIEAIKSDGKVERGEFMGLFKQMMKMVSELVQAKPPAKTRKSSRGQQTQRKDKDLMSDTGGRSKGRKREPHIKPPREQNRYKPKRQVPENVSDTDNDEDTSSEKNKDK